MNNVHKPAHDEAAGPIARRERVLDAAQAIIAAEGLRALKVRDVARAAGNSVGAVYLQFKELDALVVAVNRRTLVRLDHTLALASGADPRAQVHALAAAYLEFAAREPNLLRAMFEHRMEENRPVPDDFLNEVNTVFARIAAPLAQLLNGSPDDELAVIARTMFSAFHGIVAMGLEERIVAVPLPRLREQVALFVDAFLTGLITRPLHG